jgi:hypothetical protein
VLDVERLDVERLDAPAQRARTIAKQRGIEIAVSVDP